MKKTCIRMICETATGNRTILSLGGENRYLGDAMYGAVQQMREYAQLYKNQGGKVIRAYKYVGGLHQEIKPETRQEAQDRENWETCKRIAEEVEAYAEGRIYKCPDCGALLDLEHHDGDKYKCPDCGEIHDVDDLEQLGIWDYMDDALDIEYRVSGRMELRSVQVMIACGGPNIYIDTGVKAVRLFWWSDRAEYPLDYDACAEIDEWAEQLFECR